GLAAMEWIGQGAVVWAQPGLAQAATNAGAERPSSASRREAGAVTNSALSCALSWLMAAVRALTAPLRAVRSARMDSTIPSRRLGAAVAVLSQPGRRGEGVEHQLAAAMGCRSLLQAREATTKAIGSSGPALQDGVSWWRSRRRHSSHREPVVLAPAGDSGR